MAGSTPRSIRVDEDIQERLTLLASVAGTSVANLMSTMVDEGVAMRDHAGITFRDGPSGRRAALDGGPDVWEVALRVEQLREAGITGDDLVSTVSLETDVPESTVRRALDYWATHREEIDLRLQLHRDTAERLRERREAADQLLT